MKKQSMFYTDSQGRVRYMGGSGKKESTAQVKAVEVAPMRKKAGFFFKDELGRTRFAGGPGGGAGGATAQDKSSVSFIDAPEGIFKANNATKPTDEEKQLFLDAVNKLPDEITSLAPPETKLVLATVEGDNARQQGKWVFIGKNEYDNEVVLQHEFIHHLIYEGLGSKLNQYRPSTMFAHASRISDPRTRLNEDLGLMLTTFNRDRREWLASLRNIERGTLSDAQLNKKIDDTINFMEKVS